MRRLRAGLMAVATASAIGSVVIAALLADGRAGSESLTNDGGAWLINRGESSIGHVNRVVGEISTAVGPFSGRFEVDQAAGVVVVNDRGSGDAVLIDTNLGEAGAPVQVGPDADVVATPGGVAVHDRATASVWRFTRDEFGKVDDLDGVEPLIQGATSLQVAVGLDGTIVAVDDATDTLYLAPPGATSTSTVVAELAGRVTERLTLVGDVAVLGTVPDPDALETDADTEADADVDALVVVDGDSTLTVPVAGGLAQLQQPAGDGTAVRLITTDGTVLDAGLADGTLTEVTALEGRSFVAPIVHAGCTYALSLDPTPVFHECGRRHHLPGAGRDLELVLVNGWVWVNDVQAGSIWFVREDDLELQMISDWSAALEQNDATTDDEVVGGDEEIVVTPDADEEGEVDPLDDDDQNEAPDAVDDEFATRRGRALVVPVLANDTDPDNDPLTVEELSGVDAAGRTPDGSIVTITNDGGAIQVSPGEDFTGTVTFSYGIHDGRGGRDTARVTVDVTEPDQATNRPPITVDDNATVRAGRTVALNVLTNDRDPDGDRLVLLDVADDEGIVNFAPDGEVAYTPDVTSSEGTILLSYLVADDLGGEAGGTIRVRVRPADSNQPPQARNDIGRTTVGAPVIIDALANDSDPDGDPLAAQNLQQVDNPTTTAQLSPDGRFLFRPESPGTFRFTYAVSDGPEVAQAQIRVDVEPETENRPPVAVVDDVVLAIGDRRLVRVLDNDGDPDGDVIGLYDWVGADGLEIDEVPGVGFMVLATPTAEPRTTFRYWISDGEADPVRGDVVVSTIEREPVDYPPVAVGDSVDVRAGSTAHLSVLLNDHDPEGGLLRVVPEFGPIDEADIRVSPDRQQILLRADPDQRFSFQFSYDVEDTAGNRSSAVVNVRIVDPALPNRAPVAGPDIGRTIAGSAISVPVLTNDFDPDGDSVTVESIAQQPEHGTLEILPNGSIRYLPSLGFSGTDSFVYTIVDGYQPPSGVTDPNAPGRSLGEVFIGVMPPGAANRPPSAVDDIDFPPIRFGEGVVRLPVLTNDSDPDGDRLRVTEVTSVGVGSVGVTDDGGAVQFVAPEVGEPREVSFSYAIADGRGGTDRAAVVIDLAVNLDPLPPEAVDDTVGPVRAGDTVVVDVRENDVDLDGPEDQLVVESTDPAVTVLPSGDVSIVAPERTTDLPYTVLDAQGLRSVRAYITVLVAPNRAPEIEPVELDTLYEQPLTFDLGDYISDPDDDPLVISLGADRAGGSVRVIDEPADGLVVEFTPDEAFEGDAGFDFVVDDRKGHTVSGRAAITVLPPENRPPVADPITIEAEAGVPAVVRLSDAVTDPDLEDADIHTFSTGAPSNGDIEISQGGRGEVMVESDVTAGGHRATFEYTVSDGEYEATNTVTVELVVPVFPPPTAVEDTARTLQGEATGAIDVLANDIDNSPVGLAGDGLVITSVGVAEGGTVNQVDGRRVEFVPNPDFFGTTTFTYTVQDGRRSMEGESTGLVTVSVIGRPGQPQPPVIESIGNRYLVLGWSAPQGDAARAPVTGYELRYAADDGTTGTVTFDTPTTGYRWENLTNAVRYCFTVSAINEAGQGEFSVSPGTNECASPDVRPEAPATPTVQFGDERLTIRWNPPLNQGSPIKNYQVRISGGTQDISAALGTTTEYIWTGLANGTDYTFEVRAQNDALENEGWSEWSPLSTPEHPLTLPDAPPQPQAQRGDRQVIVTWSAPYDGGDPISRYQVRSSLSSTWVDVTPQGATNSHTWENIPNGTDVSFEVRAINRDPRSTSPGNISPPSPLVRTCSVPDAPPAPQVVRGDQQVAVSWSQPNDQGCAISEYRITNSAGATQTASANATSHVFTGLTNGTTYTFTVTAINEVVTDDGRNPSTSPASSEVVPAGKPFATNVSSATNTGVRRVRIEWPAADGNGAPVTGYELSVNGSWVSVGNSLSVTRTEQNNGTTYTYRVRAINNVGTGPAGGQQSVTTWDVPGTPNVNASGGSQQVTGSWNNPAANGTGITAHQAKLTTGGCSGGGTTRNNPGSPETFGGLDHSTTYRICVRYENAVGWGNWGSDTATTSAPPRSVTAYWGGSAMGRPGCSTSRCKYLNATGTSFTPGQTYNVVCQDNLSGSWQTYSGSYQRTANSSGTISFENVCYFGYDQYQARVVIGGVASNAISA